MKKFAFWFGVLAASLFLFGSHPAYAPLVTVEEDEGADDTAGGALDDEDEIYYEDEGDYEDEAEPFADSDTADFRGLDTDQPVPLLREN